LVVDGTAIYVNELAPRTHNSGHVTRSICTSSQFDLLARILLDAPLTPLETTTTGVHCMANLLGDSWGSQKQTPLDLAAWADYPDVVEIVLYGKKDAQSKRKMGHFVTRGPDAATAVTRARAFRQRISRDD
ncbi:MAG: ATP-grasp domain-containing protein, partial [Polyangiaceae bacterium]